MSMDTNTYLVLGYDLSDNRKDIIPEDFIESELYDEMACDKWVGEIQLFHDPMNRDYLYAGYIVGSLEEYGDPECTIISLEKAATLKERVDAKLDEWSITRGSAKFSLLMFNEFT